MSAQPLLRLSDITCIRNAKKVLNKITLDIYAAERLILCGENGSGKSSLLRICAGLLAYSTGKREQSTSTARVDFVSHEPYLYQELTPEENLSFFSRLSNRKIDQDLLKRWNLDRIFRTPVKQLSRGQVQRVSLVRAFNSQPDLLLLDEPFSHLDDVHQAILLDELDRLHKNYGSALLLSSHTMVPELATKFDRLLLSNGDLSRSKP